MLNCHDATRLMSEAQERDLSLGERMFLGFHVSMCKGCNNFKKQMGMLRSMTREFARGENKPVENSVVDKFTAGKRHDAE